MLKTDESVSIDTCEELLREWVHSCDRSAPVGDDGFNDAHVAGMGLAVVCCKSLHHLEFEWEKELYNVSDRILTPEQPLQQMSWTDLKHVIQGIQIEFNRLFTMHEDTAYVAVLDLITILLMTMARTGFLISHRWQPCTKGDVSLSVEDVENIVSVSQDGWRELSATSIVQMLDALHALAAGTLLIISAQPVPCRFKTEPLHNYHREASLDTFYEMSQIVDCPWGSITQYAHSFVHLFHSTSQVVYFHSPNYERRRQKKMQELEAEDVDNVHLLPLLLQVEPTISVTYEHTGLGLRRHHALSRWQWCIVGGFVLLVDDSMQVWFGDARQLLALAREKHRQRDGEAEQPSAGT